MFGRWVWKVGLEGRLEHRLEGRFERWVGKVVWKVGLEGRLEAWLGR